MGQLIVARTALVVPMALTPPRGGEATSFAERIQHRSWCAARGQGHPVWQEDAITLGELDDTVEAFRDRVTGASPDGWRHWRATGHVINLLGHGRVGVQTRGTLVATAKIESISLTQFGETAAALSLMLNWEIPSTAEVLDPDALLGALRAATRLKQKVRRPGRNGFCLAAGAAAAWLDIEDPRLQPWATHAKALGNAPIQLHARSLTPQLWGMLYRGRAMFLGDLVRWLIDGSTCGARREPSLVVFEGTWATHLTAVVRETEGANVTNASLAERIARAETRSHAHPGLTRRPAQVDREGRLFAFSSLGFGCVSCLADLEDARGKWFERTDWPFRVTGIYRFFWLDALARRLASSTFSEEADEAVSLTNERYRAFRTAACEVLGGPRRRVLPNQVGARTIRKRAVVATGAVLVIVIILGVVRTRDILDDPGARPAARPSASRGLPTAVVRACDSVAFLRTMYRFRLKDAMPGDEPVARWVEGAGFRYGSHDIVSCRHVLAPWLEQEEWSHAVPESLETVHLVGWNDQAFGQKEARRMLVALVGPRHRLPDEATLFKSKCLYLTNAHRGSLFTDSSESRPDLLEDIAVLRLPPTSSVLPPGLSIARGPAARPVVGKELWLASYPDGSRQFLDTVVQNTTWGRITSHDASRGQFQADARFQHGSSGGPYLDAQGRVVGMAQRSTHKSGAFGAEDDADPQNLAWSVDADGLAVQIRALLEGHGR